MGAAFGSYRELRERYFRTGEQTFTHLSLELLGQVPKVNDAPSWGGPRRNAGRLIGHRRQIARYVADHPRSAFAEAMRSTKLAIDLRLGDKRPKIIGIVSVAAREGKSTIAMNLAQHIAAQGHSCRLLDYDLRNPTISATLAGKVEKGLASILSGESAVSDVLLTDKATGLTFVPVERRSAPRLAGEVPRTSMGELLQNQNDAEYVVVDLPPIGSIVDARALEQFIDAFVLAIEWGHTPRKVVMQVLNREGWLRNKCVGVLLNKVDTRRLRLYDADAIASYYTAADGGGRNR